MRVIDVTESKDKTIETDDDNFPYYKRYSAE